LPEPRASDRVPPRPDVAQGEGLGAPAFAAWRRLHPAAIAVWISGVAGGLAFPLVAIVLFGGEGGPLVFTTVAGALAVGGSAVRWVRFWYRLDGRTLVLRGGLLQRWERTLQPARIQSVDVVQKLTHRVFGVVELRIEVVGGRGTEAALVAMTPAEANGLRALLLADRSDEETVPEPPLVRMRPVDLLVAGATGGRVAVVAAMVGWLTQILPQDRFVDALGRIAGEDRSSLVTIVVIAGLLLVASVLISLVSTLIVYWSFTARRQGDQLVITRGLLQTRRSVVPVGRIQAIRMEENLIRRSFGLASLRVMTAGYGRGSGDAQQSSMLVPVADRSSCLAIAEDVLGTQGLRGSALHRAPPRALARRLVGAGIVTAGIVATAFAVRPAVVPAAFVVLAVAIGLALLSWRALGHAILGHHVLARDGALVRRTTVADLANIQHLQLRRSPSQRPFRLASLALAIPKSSAGLIDVDRDVAEDRFDELASRLVS
jgi:putative membrane protein